MSDFGPTAGEVQWRNINKVVEELAKFCFGGPKQPGTINLNSAYMAITIALTAKNGIDVRLEPLPVSDINREQAARIQFLEDSLKTATMYVTQAIGEVDDICDASPQTYADPKPKAKRAANYLRQAWDILDPSIS